MNPPPIDAAQHLGLVHLCANRFRERGIEYDELYSAGCLGLVKAANAFDPGRGVCFSTYAVPVIIGEIRRLFREGGSVHIGRHLQEISRKAARTAEQLRQQTGREPTVRQIAEAIKNTLPDILAAGSDLVGAFGGAILDSLHAASGGL